MLNYEAIRQRLKELHGKDQAGFGRAINVDKANVTLMLKHGKRKLQLNEIPIAAQYLEWSVDELLRQIGIPVTPPPVQQIQLVGTIEKNGRVTDIAPENVSAELPPLPQDAVAYHVKEAPLIRGALIVSLPVKSISPDAMGRLSIVRTSTHTMHLCHLSTTFRTGIYSMEFPDGSIKTDTIEGASPVLFVKP